MYEQRHREPSVSSGQTAEPCQRRDEEDDDPYRAVAECHVRSEAAAAEQREAGEEDLEQDRRDEKPGRREVPERGVPDHRRASHPAHLEIAALGLLRLDGFEQGLEVADAEAA